MSIEYLSQVETEAHAAAMQRVVEERRSRLEAFKSVQVPLLKDLQELAATDAASESQLAAMQRDFEHLPLLRQVYHEAPDNVFELIVSKCLDRWGGVMGGLNSFRLTNKRCKQVVDSCTTMLTHLQKEGGPISLPISIIQRCRRLEAIRCESHNLRSLEGCPDGLKRLTIGDASHLSDLFPLASCSMLESLEIWDSSITDISVVSSMPLHNFASQKLGEGQPSIKDLSPLSSCPRLKDVYLYGNRELEDLSALSHCKCLYFLDIAECSLTASLAPLSTCTTLEDLSISGCPLISSLSPLSNLLMLKSLKLDGNQEIDDLAPLSLCTALESLHFMNAPHLSDLSPLASCSMMKALMIMDSSITDISAVSSMPLLQEFSCQKLLGSPSIKDLSPLSSCALLRWLVLDGNLELEDLSPLSACVDLEDFGISDCPLITSLAPLSSLKKLMQLDCRGIDPHTSLLPLTSCTELKMIQCDEDAVDLAELRRRRPGLSVHLEGLQLEDGNGDEADE